MATRKRKFRYHANPLAIEHIDDLDCDHDCIIVHRDSDAADGDPARTQRRSLFFVG